MTAYTHYRDYIQALNDFLHTWMPEYKNIELEYVRIEAEDTDDEIYAYPDEDYMYIIWANGKQSRINISVKSERKILSDFLNKEYEDVPENEYI